MVKADFRDHVLVAFVGDSLVETDFRGRAQVEIVDLGLVARTEILISMAQPIWVSLEPMVNLTVHTLSTWKDNVYRHYKIKCSNNKLPLHEHVICKTS